jgi:hypothetical protein
VRYVVGVVLLGLLGWFTLWNTTPSELVYLDGVRPTADSYDRGCVFDEPGMKNCSTTTAFRWQLPAGGATLRSTMTISRSDTTSITGLLAQERSQCPDSRVSWEVTAGGRTLNGVLAAGSTELVVPGPAADLVLTLHRDDSAACASEFQWQRPELIRPSFSWPWS